MNMFLLKKIKTSLDLIFPGFCIPEHFIWIFYLVVCGDIWWYCVVVLGVTWWYLVVLGGTWCPSSWNNDSLWWDHWVFWLESVKGVWTDYWLVTQQTHADVVLGFYFDISVFSVFAFYRQCLVKFNKVLSESNSLLNPLLNVIFQHVQESKTTKMLNQL